jgi:hypoxanthine-DNA glycosylase
LSVKVGLPPVADKFTRLFILGSLPGEESLKQRRYYAYPTNQFWKLVGSVIGHELHSRDYDDRLALLRRHGIGLWDVVSAASREGSGDQAIRNARHNDIGALKGDYPNLKAIAFNGGRAAKDGLRLLEGIPGVDLHALPSSSAAYARMPFSQKATEWAKLRRYLQS